MKNTYLLWADFETTGLDPRMDTILEAAWTITDADLRMLTPLRSRLCLIDPPNRRRDAAHTSHPLRSVAKFDVGHHIEDAVDHWYLLPDVVQDMHKASGLRDELQRAANNPVESLRMVTTANGLWRLIADDLADVGYDFSGDSLVLAGAGVSHFDNRVLAHHMPSRFPLGGDGRTGFAYWQHDVSVARRVIGERTWEDLKSKVNNPKRSLKVYGCQVVLPEREGYAPVRVNQVPDAEEFGEAPFVFMPDEFTGHRAADDVAWALIDGRILRGVNW